MNLRAMKLLFLVLHVELCSSHTVNTSDEIQSSLGGKTAIGGCPSFYQVLQFSSSFLICSPHSPISMSAWLAMNVSINLLLDESKLNRVSAGKYSKTP